MTFGIGQKRMLFLCCGWSCVPSNVLLDQMTSCILSKCGSFLHCGWAYAFSKCQLDQKTSCILSKCASFLRYAWAFADSGVQQNQMTSCTEHNKISFPCCGSPYASSEFLVNQMTSGILHNCVFSFFGVAFFWRWLVTISVNWVDSYSRTCRHCTKTLWSLIIYIFPLSFFSLIMVRCISSYKVFPICPITSYNISFELQLNWVKWLTIIINETSWTESND